MCARCGVTPAAEGRTKCPDCLDYEAVAQYMRYWRMSKREKQKLYEQIGDCQKRLRKKRREEGICTRCGKRKADIGYVTCGKCRAKAREKARVQKGKR